MHDLLRDPRHRAALVHIPRMYLMYPMYPTHKVHEASLATTVTTAFSTAIASAFTSSVASSLSSTLTTTIAATIAATTAVTISAFISTTISFTLSRPFQCEEVPLEAALHTFLDELHGVCVVVERERRLVALHMSFSEWVQGQRNLEWGPVQWHCSVLGLVRHASITDRVPL